MALLHGVALGVCLGLVGANASWAQQTSVETPDTLRQRAVAEARAGRLAEALALFAQLRQSVPADRAVLYDYAVVLTWAGRNAEALELLARMAPRAAPDYVLEALAKAARDAHRYDQAITLYRLLLERRPDHPQARLGLALALTDGGQFPEAKRRFDELLKETPYDIGRLLGYAYYWQRNRNFARALALFEQVLRVDPGNREALSGKALAKARQPAPPPPSPAQIAAQAEQKALLELRARAVTQARNGRFEQALQLFEQLRARAPADPAVVYDYAVALTWAGRLADALRLLPRIDRRAAPLYVLEALAKAARDSHAYDQALALYRAILKRQPDHPQARLGLALTLTDSDRKSEAQAQWQALIGHQPKDSAALLGFAYFWRRNGEYAQEALMYERILAFDPTNRDALRGRVLALSALGAAHLALAYAEPRQELFSAAELRKLYSDRAAIQARWAGLPQADPARSTAMGDQAIAWMEQALGRPWSELNLDDAADRRLAFDQLVALHSRKRMADVIKLYDRLVAAKLAIPAYALGVVASAFLTERQPERARDVYRQMLALEPKSFEARMGLFYALTETEDYQSAFAVIDQLAKEQPAWRGGSGGVPRKSNPDKLTVDATALMARAYADDLSHAQRGLEAMVEAAPGNAGLRANLAAVYRWRGWLKQAEDQYRRALRLEPDDLAARIGQANTALDRDDDDFVAAEVGALLRSHGDNPQVQKLAQAWELRNRPELRIETSVGRSSGDTQGSADLGYDNYLYSSRSGHVRGFAHDHYASAKFTEGFGVDHRLGVGLEYARPGLRLGAELNQGLRDNDELGWSLKGLGWLGDHWRMDGVVEHNSVDAPLRAIRAGIHADHLGLGVGYRWHESQDAALSAQYYDFSDGNVRKSVAAAFARRLLATPSYKMGGRLGIYASENSRVGAPYFNPSRDFSWEIGISNDWRIWRRYERSFSQRLTLGAGGYWQEGHGDDLVWSMQYEHDWQLSERFSVQYGIDYGRRVYDGNSEYESELHAQINLRF